MEIDSVFCSEPYFSEGEKVGTGNEAASRFVHPGAVDREVQRFRGRCGGSETSQFPAGSRFVG